MCNIYIKVLNDLKKISSSQGKFCLCDLDRFIEVSIFNFLLFIKYIDTHVIIITIIKKKSHFQQRFHRRVAKKREMEIARECRHDAYPSPRWRIAENREGGR